jgi:hypothetical protein
VTNLALLIDIHRLNVCDVCKLEGIVLRVLVGVIDTRSAGPAIDSGVEIVHQCIFGEQVEPSLGTRVKLDLDLGRLRVAGLDEQVGIMQATGETKTGRRMSLIPANEAERRSGLTSWTARRYGSDVVVALGQTQLRIERIHVKSVYT